MIKGDIAPPSAISKIINAISFVFIPKINNTEMIAKNTDDIMQTVFIKITRLLLKKLLIEAKESPASPATTIINDKIADALAACSSPPVSAA